MKVKQHYDTLLGNIYSWMVGDFTYKMKEQKQFFVENGIEPKSTKVAIDLGAGHGLQSIGLAQCGYRVTAVDLNKGIAAFPSNSSTCATLSRCVSESPMQTINSAFRFKVLKKLSMSFSYMTSSTKIKVATGSKK